MDTNTAVEAQQTFLQTLALFMEEGGVFMWVILGLWTFGISISIERVKSLFLFDIKARNFMATVKKHVLANEVAQAIQLCSNSKSLLAKVIRSGLKRANQTKEQITDALDATTLEVLPMVDKRMGYMALCANISTLLGLLGTIAGLIQSFAAVASADPSSKAKLLALGISKAMNTTAMGLLAAISLMAIHAILTNKGEKIVADIDEHSLKLVDLLATKNRRMYLVNPEATPEMPSMETQIQPQAETVLPPPPLKEVA